MSQPVAKPPADRLEALGRSRSPRRKPEGGPPALLPKHRLLIEYQIHGCSKPELLARITRPTPVIENGEPVIRDVSPKPGEPLTLIEAADLLRIRRRNARELAGLKVYRAAFDAELEKYRNGERFASMRTIVEVRDELGEGRAADRKVRLEASKALLGEDFQAGSTINVQVNNGVAVTPGIVVRRYHPRDVEADAKTIEHEAREPSEDEVDG